MGPLAEPPAGGAPMEGMEVAEEDTDDNAVRKGRGAKR